MAEAIILAVAVSSSERDDTILENIASDREGIFIVLSITSLHWKGLIRESWQVSELRFFSFL